VLISDLLELEELHLKVRAFGQALDRRIRWVHPTELIDPSLYLQGGELILTTGVWRKRPDDEKRFVASLVRANACGLVYGLPKPNARMLPGLVAECERNELPLLEASYELPFVRISEAFVATLTDARQTALLRAIRRSEQLVDLVARGGGSAAILRVLSQDQALPSWLLGPGGRVIESTSPRPSAEEVRGAWRAITETSGFPIELSLQTDVQGSVFPVSAAGHVTGYLVVKKGLTELDPEERTAVDQALSFLGLESMRIHAERALSARFARELLDLITLGESRAMEITSRLRAFGLNPDAPLTLMVALIPSAGAQQLDRAAELTEWFFTEQGLPAVTPAVGDEVFAIVSPSDPAADLRKLAEDLAQTLASELAPQAVAVGVGAPVRDPAKLRRCLVEARHASRLAALRKSSPSVSTSEEIGSHSLLLALHEEDLLRTFHSALLGPVVDYDARRGSELVHTLAVFLDMNGGWQEAAAALSIHVNTLRYRLARIEALTGRSLDTMENRVDFYLALRSARQGGDGFER
jgi:PucR family transcriptional regulator, purine catabolism regulatory protein